MFFKAAGHARGAVVLQDRDGHDLVDRLRDQFAQVRSILALILRIVAVRDQVHPDEGVVIETGDRIPPEGGEVQLELIPIRIQPAPLDVGREDLLVTGIHQLATIAIVYEDVPGFHAGGLELLDHFEDDFEGGVGMRLAVGDDLDADHVAGLEEMLPGLDRIGGAGEGLHAGVEGRLDGRVVPRAVVDHPRVLDLDDAAGIKAGSREFAQGLPVAALMSRLADGRGSLGGGQGRGSRDQRDRGGRGGKNWRRLTPPHGYRCCMVVDLSQQTRNTSAHANPTPRRRESRLR